MKRQGDQLFFEEYEKLNRVGCDQSKAVGLLEVNRSKNRYKNILPYDKNRVKLSQLQGSDYINANYIAGINSDNEYIATQAPLNASKHDFWRMIWEHKCKYIVMLTQLEESGKRKSIQYWPKNEKITKLQDFRLKTTSVAETTNYTITTIQLSKNNDQQSVHHFHFTAWDDKSVPEYAKNLIEFVLRVRETVKNETQAFPIVAHCSAGVGRTGTFIAVDQILQNLYLQDRIDVYGQINQLRMQRTKMVQTKQQYIFIYKVIEDYLNNTEAYENFLTNPGELNVVRPAAEPLYQNV